MCNAKRVLDIVVGGALLIATLPLFGTAAIGIRLTSAGPVFYRARRIARDRRRMQRDRRDEVWTRDRRRQDGYRGREFTMYKFRTMRVATSATTDPITALNDPRVFPFGAFLRVTKIDELPQLINVLKGDMALVGPRPEAPEIVRSHYTPDDLTTLQVPPGVTSPGTVYYYTRCESMLVGDTVVNEYVRRVLPTKLALDRVYIKRPGLLYDIRVILRTIAAMVARTLGRRSFREPPEQAEATVTAAYHPTDEREFGVRIDR